MRSILSRLRTIGITYRVAFLSWSVTVVTLFFFVLVIIPVQERTVVEDLTSKAQAVALSLGDVTISGILTGDFASAVDSCRERLLTDRSLEYLVITRRDGLAVYHDRAGWRTQTNASEWLPKPGQPSSSVGTVPFYEGRVFHHCQPFEYVGIPLGWIQVGLSIESYDQNIAYVYRRTGLVAGICVIFSLIVSAFYARRLVQPILIVREVVQRVAGGDLAARVRIDRGDELGNLASSVNSMTEALLRRDRIVQSVRFAAQQFLSTLKWEDVINEVLERIGRAAGVCQVYVYDDAVSREDLLQAPSFVWMNSQAGVSGRCLSALAQPPESEIEQCLAAMGRGETITTSFDFDAPTVGLETPHPGGTKISVIWSPIFVEGAWWGVLGLETHDAVPRTWTDAEQDSIRAAANILGAAIARQRTQDSLVEAKEMLEVRVEARTKELREQVTAKERARSELMTTQHQLVELSRRTGRAEVATGVLHNVGNVLNSVNVSVNLLRDRLRSSTGQNLQKAAAMLTAHRSDLGVFLQQDPKGKLLPEYITKLAVLLREERDQLTDEIQSLSRSIDHIKEIVAMQQNYARVAGVVEDLPVHGLVEDALCLQSATFARHRITVEQDFAEVPQVRVDKHKVLQILVNLLRNAKDAMKTSTRPDKHLWVRVALNGGEKVKVVIEDNGVGIAPENLTRIFQHGFTTKAEGHGFGLHSGALAAQEMGGSLWAASGGPGLGAAFTLELPIAVKQEN